MLPREGLVLLILLLQERSPWCLVLRLAMGSRAVCCGEDANWGDWGGRDSHAACVDVVDVTVQSRNAAPPQVPRQRQYSPGFYCKRTADLGSM